MKIFIETVSFHHPHIFFLIIAKDVCMEISKRYEVYFLETGTDKNHVHFLILSVPTDSITKTVTLIKRVTTRTIFRIHPEVKRQLRGGEFWTDGYFSIQ